MASNASKLFADCSAHPDVQLRLASASQVRLYVADVKRRFPRFIDDAILELDRIFFSARYAASSAYADPVYETFQKELAFCRTVADEATRDVMICLAIHQAQSDFERLVFQTADFGVAGFKRFFADFTTHEYGRIQSQFGPPPRYYWTWDEYFENKLEDVYHELSFAGNPRPPAPPPFTPNALPPPPPLPSPAHTEDQNHVRIHIFKPRRIV